CGCRGRTRLQRRRTGRRRTLPPSTPPKRQSRRVERNDERVQGPTCGDRVTRANRQPNQATVLRVGRGALALPGWVGRGARHGRLAGRVVVLAVSREAVRRGSGRLDRAVVRTRGRALARGGVVLAVVRRGPLVLGVRVVRITLIVPRRG